MHFYWPEKNYLLTKHFWSVEVVIQNKGTVETLYIENDTL